MIKKFLVLAILLFGLAACAASKVPSEVPAVDDSHVLGVEVDPGDVMDHGMVTFIVVYGETAKGVLEDGKGNLRIIDDKAHGPLLVYFEPDQAAPDGDDVVMVGVFDFRIVSGKSADKVLKSIGKFGHFLKADEEAKVIYLLMGAETKDI